MNYGRVTHILGNFCLLISGLLGVPMVVSLLHGETGDAPAFLIPMGGGLLLGWLARARFKGAKRAMYRREGLLVVCGCWLLAALIGAVPFLLSGAIPRVDDAIFESVSGFTTTGSTILPAIEGLPKGILFWRSMTHWLGGMGIVVLFVAVLPALGVGGRLLYEFEVPGVEADDLKPRIRETALALWKIYLALTLLEVGALLACGLSVYDAVVHTFGTVATGGFSTYDASVGHFGMPVVEIVITVFMFLAGVNFTLYYRAGKEGFGAITRDPEFRTYAMLTGIVIVFVIGVLLVSAQHGSAGRVTLDAAFTVVAIGTTTGYGTADFDKWPDVVRLALVMLMFVGGSAGSTAGGMKVFRIMLVFRCIMHELKRFVRPHRIRALMVAGHTVHDETVRNVMVFFAVSILIFAGGSLAMASLGLDIETATSSVVATLWNIGPGLGQVGPTQNFSEVPAAGKWLLTVLMLFGRLEIFTAAVIFMPGFYRD